MCTLHFQVLAASLCKIRTTGLLYGWKSSFLFHGVLLVVCDLWRTERLGVCLPTWESLFLPCPESRREDIVRCVKLEMSVKSVYASKIV